MRKNIKLWAIIFAFTLQSGTMWSATTSMHPVSLHCQQGPLLGSPLLGSNPKPTKAPAKYSIPLSMFFDDENLQLLVTALGEVEITYYVYNASDEVVSQGVLNCTTNDNYTIELGLCSSGTYSVAVTYNGSVFKGTFEISE